MLNNAKLLRWLAPCCLLILLVLLILAINFTSPQTSNATGPDRISALSTTVAHLQQTVTAQGKISHPTPTPPPAPTVTPTLIPSPTSEGLPTPSPTPKTPRHTP